MKVFTVQKIGEPDRVYTDEQTARDSLEEGELMSHWEAEGVELATSKKCDMALPGGTILKGATHLKSEKKSTTVEPAE